MPCAQVQGYPVSRSVLAQKLRIIGPGLDLLSALVMIPAALKPVVFGDALPSECRHGAAYRSEERRVGKACVSTCRSRWLPYHEKKKEGHTDNETIGIYDKNQKNKN